VQIEVLGPVARLFQSRVVLQRERRIGRGSRLQNNRRVGDFERGARRKLLRGTRGVVPDDLAGDPFSSTKVPLRPAK
jgi:hypothetical protein